MAWLRGRGMPGLIGCLLLLVLLAVGIIVSQNMKHPSAAPVATQAAQAVSTPISAPTQAPVPTLQQIAPTAINSTADQSPPFYLGVTPEDVAARMGTPTLPEPAILPSGYGTCPNYPGFDGWKVGLDAASGRVNYIAPRGGCTNNPQPWREWSKMVLPPDATFESTTDPQGLVSTAEVYHSDWLDQRIGCGTIVVRGDDQSDGWNATTAC